MDFNAIPLSAAGSLSVAVVAIFFFAFQSFFFLKKRKFTYNVWAAIFSLSTSGYAFFVFLQYIAPPAGIQHMIDKAQFTFLAIMIQSITGFSFSYLEVPSGLYHKIAGPINLIILIVLWSTGWIFNDTLVVRNFIWVARPYVESEIGPLGAPFMAYLIASASVSLFFWIRKKTRDVNINRVVGSGLAIFILLGVHDALASLGIFRAVQFLLEYGFLAFSTSILYLTVREYIQIENQAFVLQRVNEELGIIARTDGLTKLANRYSFDRQYEKEWRILKRQRRQKTLNGCLSLILCDIDFFKEYNDTYGHKAGDSCLVLVAEILAACARRPADFVSRYGGDEFAVLLPDTIGQGAMIVAEHMLNKMRERKIENKSSGIKPWVTLSLGIATILSEDELSQEELFDKADRALYAAKKKGRDRFDVNNENE
jgi:diguanylate cyclase (GGDEF)-like protein